MSEFWSLFRIYSYANTLALNSTICLIDFKISKTNIKKLLIFKNIKIGLPAVCNLEIDFGLSYKNIWITKEIVNKFTP